MARSPSGADLAPVCLTAGGSGAWSSRGPAMPSEPPLTNAPIGAAYLARPRSASVRTLTSAEPGCALGAPAWSVYARRLHTDDSTHGGWSAWRSRLSPDATTVCCHRCCPQAVVSSAPGFHTPGRRFPVVCHIVATNATLLIALMRYSVFRASFCALDEARAVAAPGVRGSLGTCGRI
jgi:hypothetical protein